jgi:signal transduction histidine kinase
MFMSGRSKLWTLLASSLIIAQAVASLFLHEGFALAVCSDLVQWILLLSGAIALATNIPKTHGRTRLFWILMTAGISLWFVYQTLWSYFEVLLRKPVPFVFAGDAVLFLHLVPMIAAVALQPHEEQDERTVRLGSLDFALLLIWWLYLYVFSVMPWEYAFLNEEAYGKNLNSVYLTEKLVFLAVIGALWMRSRGDWGSIYAQWFGASLLYALSSYVANWALVRGVYYSGCVYDLPLEASMAWVIAVGLFAASLSPRKQPARKSALNGVWIARLGMVTIFSLPLFAGWSVFVSSVPEPVRTFRLLLTLATMLFMGALVFYKQHLLDHELLGLLRASEESVENLRRVQAQLVQSEKLASLGQLVGGAAHELNNPLTAMLGYSDLLSEMALTEQQRALTQKIVYQVRRTKTLVSSLLSFAKQVPAEKTLVDIQTLAGTAIKLSNPQFRAVNIQVRIEAVEKVPRILGDSNQLLQVFLHIINNALQAMSEVGDLLTMVVRAEEGFVVIEFLDNGPGVREIDRVFDPFYTTRPIGQGTGLGLSACYGIIQEHGGKISCSNRTEGGALFRIELPFAVNPAPSSLRVDSESGVPLLKN